MSLVYGLLIGILLISAYIAVRLTTRKSGSEVPRLLEDLEKLRKDLQDARIQDRDHLQKRIEYVSKTLDDGLRSSEKNVQDHLRHGHEIIKEVTEKLTKLDDTNRQVINFSSQLEDLQRILKQPKGKGILGEYWLGTMLSHVLQPDQYKLQYKFKNGEIVDAVVFSQNKIIPIDAKFSSEKYVVIDKEKDLEKRTKLEEDFKKDLKLRIDETAKYIRPGENTTDYAFMFIPAEGIYYDLLVSKIGTIKMNQINLIKYAHDRRVLIVSPNTFFAFLQTVIEGMRAFKIQESVQHILKRVEQLGKHLISYDSFMKKLGNNLGTTVGMYNQAYKEFKKVDKDVFKLSANEIGGSVETIELDKPSAHIEEAFEQVTTKQITRGSTVIDRES